MTYFNVCRVITLLTSFVVCLPGVSCGLTAYFRTEMSEVVKREETRLKVLAQVLLPPDSRLAAMVATPTVSPGSVVLDVISS